MAVVAWILWSIVLLYGLVMTLSGVRDPGVRLMMRTQGVVVVVACLAIAFLHLSKFWALLVVPVAFILPPILMGLGLGRLAGRTD